MIHTPSPKATKWWPGDLGLHCTHAVVFARLIIGKNQFGVLPFLVQIRDMETFMPLKGVELGDIGPKFGYNSKNNGWATFDSVRIPRDNMLMKYTRVDRQGNFSVEGDMRVLYSVMMDIRLQLLLGSSKVLFKGLLIGGRYSAVRRQFKNTQGSRLETKLLDYQTQQMKLFPLLAAAFTFLIAHNFVDQMYKELLQGIQKGKFDKLEVLHHLTSGMKSFFTQTAVDGAYLIRQSVGGAGYSAWSALPQLIDHCNSWVTFEGDNTVMAQQSAKLIMKNYKKVKQHEKLTGIFEYFNSAPNLHLLRSRATSAEDYCTIEHVQEALQAISLYQIELTMQKLDSTKASKKESLNMINGLEVVSMATIHIQCVNFNISVEALPKIACPKFRQHVTNLVCLMGLTHLQQNGGIGYESGFLSAGSLVLINDAFKELLVRIRPQFIALVELFPASDNVLMSAIGNSYGDIYETHLEWAKTSRLN